MQPSQTCPKTCQFLTLFRSMQARAQKSYQKGKCIQLVHPDGRGGHAHCGSGFKPGAFEICEDEMGFGIYDAEVPQTTQTGLFVSQI